MKQIGSIQILRALAALMVVLAHAQDDSAANAARAGLAFARSGLLPWVAGVDLFFVISGFIMVVASERLFAAPGGAAAFLTRRIIRIVPLYWLVTALMLGVAALLARHGQAEVPSLAEIATSLGFVPYARADGAARPVVSLGWTLNYEMFFYLVFAAFLALRREAAVAGVAASLMLLVGVGALVHPQATALAYWSDPIVLEFVLGMGLALAWRSGRRLPVRPALGLAAAATGLLALDLAHMGDVAAFGVDPNGFSRVFACGVPMAALLAAIVLVRPSLPAGGRVATPLALIGDASYALYLFHPIVVVLARKAYLAAHLAPALGFWPLVVADMIAACALAVAIHLLVERPVTVALQARFAGRPSAAGAVSRAGPAPASAPSAAAGPPAPVPSRGR